MAIDVDENTAKQLHKMMQDLANFTALYEQSEDRMMAQKEQLQNQINAFKNEIELQIQNIHQTVTELNDVMTAAGGH